AREGVFCAACRGSFENSFQKIDRAAKFLKSISKNPCCFCAARDIMSTRTAKEVLAWTRSSTDRNI
ncbi:MAG: hypothetical protein II965_00390, partial [Pyramidobacter sp.]|nr:hypothetical protein [Pyramidobacter sp.]